MPKLPDDWLGWLTLIGSIAGLLAAIKLFVFSLWFNSFQRHVLLAMEQSEAKVITVFRQFGGGIIFHVTPKAGDIPNDYYDYFMDGGKNGASHANFVYLEELSKKGYLSFTPEMIKLGDKEIKDEVYTITAKGLRVARIFKFLYSVKSN